MNATNTSLSLNVSFVRPEYFFITGLTGIPYTSYYYIFLFCIYFIAVFGNSAVLVIIAVDRSLHIPKYISMFNLALSDFGETNALIPSMMKTFFFDSQYISYNACLANMFFVFFFTTMQCSTLVVLAYDRFVAICLPLRYHVFVTNNIMCLIFSVIWIFNAFMIGTMVSLINRLSFCKTNVALTKITTWEGRLKALKTCVTHLLLVASLFLPLFCIYMVASTITLPANTRILTVSLAYAVPPMINPIIYVLNTAEIKNFIRKVFENKSGPI